MYTAEAPKEGGIIAFTHIASDYGKFALVEFVARDPAAFKEILADKRAAAKIFHKGKDKKADIDNCGSMRRISTWTGCRLRCRRGGEYADPDPCVGDTEEGADFGSR